MLPFHQLVTSDFAEVNQLIIDQLHSDVGLVEDIGHYLVEAGGKRLRPLLTLLTANTLGFPHHTQAQSPHIMLAAVIEFIHTATLLHDDVVDISAMRRGRQTANAKWGNAPSVLVGDFLYSRAFQLMVAIGQMDIMKILSDTTNIISEGEVQQLVNAKDPSVSEENYFNVIHKKTAVLFQAACETAAVLANTPHPLRLSTRQYGYHVGMAFQLVDDALDYQGDAKALGKNVGDDLTEGKPTLPLIYAMQQGTSSQSELIAQAIQSGGLEHLEDIITIVNETGALDYTFTIASSHVAKAIEALTPLPENTYSRAMIELAEFAVHRTH